MCRVHVITIRSPAPSNGPSVTINGGRCRCLLHGVRVAVVKLHGSARSARVAGVPVHEAIRIGCWCWLLSAATPAATLSPAPAAAPTASLACMVGRCDCCSGCCFDSCFEGCELCDEGGHGSVCFDLAGVPSSRGCQVGDASLDVRCHGCEGAVCKKWEFVFVSED